MVFLTPIRVKATNKVDEEKSSIAAYFAEVKKPNIQNSVVSSLSPFFCGRKFVC
jgi:hypothetical protein